jgi:phage/plasmid-associated DNA primase
MPETNKKLSLKELRLNTVDESTRVVVFNGALIAQYNTRWERNVEGVLFDILGRSLRHTEALDIMDYYNTRLEADATDELSGYIQLGDCVWDMRTLTFKTLDDIMPVYTCPYAPSSDQDALNVVDNYLLELADGDEGVAHDILQACAPVIMDKKPTGIIWFVGSGANGKSMLLSVLYRLFGENLVSVSPKDIEDGRDAPNLNGHLANVVKEASEAYIEDSERYKALGTHEDFFVHRFHSQNMVKVCGNVHCIFNANTIPTFADKSQGTSRRTLVVQFNRTFTIDETFEARTFTPEFLGAFLTRLLDMAREISANNYCYEWSTVSQQTKEDYDDEANSVMAFIKDIKSNHPDIIGWTNYAFLRQYYENWCSQNGYTALGIKNLKQIMRSNMKLDSHVVRCNDGVKRLLLFKKAQTIQTVVGVVVSVDDKALAELSLEHETNGNKSDRLFE